MLELIDDYDEYEFIIAAIRRSTIEYTPQLRDRIEAIEAEYDLRLTGNQEEGDHLEQSIQAFVTALQDHIHREERRREHNSVVRTMHELRFCREQKHIYFKVYNALAGSALPYSASQRELLGLIRRDMDSTTGRPTDSPDTTMIDNLQAFFVLLARDDFDSTYTRLVIYATIDHHAGLIINELRSTVVEEGGRNNPFSYLEDSRVNLATFVTDKLQSIFNIRGPEESDFTCKAGYREIFSKAITLLLDSGLPFSSHQLQLIRNLCRTTNSFNGDPDSEDMEILRIQFLTLIEDIRNEHPRREIITTHTASMIDIHGPVNKAVEYILLGLQDLSRATTAHFLSFGRTTARSPDLLPLVVRHFLRIYPPRYTFPQPRAHNESTSQRDRSTST